VLAEKKYNSNIDLLRILSILSVIIIHITTKSLELAKYDLVHHPLIMFFNQAPRFAVPLFFLISAFVLELNYPQNFNYFSYLKKRFSRLFLPYLFWSTIYYFVIFPNHSHSFFTNLLTGDSSYQLYFIPSLFIFYLFFPLIHRLINFLKNKIAIIIFGIIQLSILSFDYYFHPLYLPYPISVFLLNFDIFILGVLASRNQNNILDFVKKYQKIFYFVTIALSLFITWEGRSLYLKTNNYLSFYSQWRPTIFIYTLIISSLFIYLFGKLKINTNFVKKMASYSFFVYFIHIIFIEIIYRYLPLSLFSTPILPFLMVTVSSYFLAFTFSKIPLISKLTG
jgi:surface polysaccharide O-acyltransferase-like enzyme